jgi:hypothetical protein
VLEMFPKKSRNGKQNVQKNVRRLKGTKLEDLFIFIFDRASECEK